MLVFVQWLPLLFYAAAWPTDVFIYFFRNTHTHILVYIYILFIQWQARAHIAEIVNKANVLLYCWGIINNYNIIYIIFICCAVENEQLCYLNKHIPNTNILYYMLCSVYNIHAKARQTDNEHLCKQCIFFLVQLYKLKHII